MTEWSADRRLTITLKDGQVYTYTLANASAIRELLVECDDLRPFDYVVEKEIHICRIKVMKLGKCVGFARFMYPNPELPDTWLCQRYEDAALLLKNSETQKVIKKYRKLLGREYLFKPCWTTEWQTIEQGRREPPSYKRKRNNKGARNEGIFDSANVKVHP